MEPQQHVTPAPARFPSLQLSPLASARSHPAAESTSPLHALFTLAEVAVEEASAVTPSSSSSAHRLPSPCNSVLPQPSSPSPLSTSTHKRKSLEEPVAPPPPFERSVKPRIEIEETPVASIPSNGNPRSAHLLPLPLLPQPLAQPPILEVTAPDANVVKREPSPLQDDVQTCEIKVSGPEIRVDSVKVEDDQEASSSHLEPHPSPSLTSDSEEPESRLKSKGKGRRKSNEVASELQSTERVSLRLAVRSISHTEPVVPPPKPVQETSPKRTRPASKRRPPAKHDLYEDHSSTKKPHKPPGAVREGEWPSDSDSNDDHASHKSRKKPKSKGKLTKDKGSVDAEAIAGPSSRPKEPLKKKQKLAVDTPASMHRACPPSPSRSVSSKPPPSKDKGKGKGSPMFLAGPGIELQNLRCLHARYINTPRCFSCVRKVSGEACRFAGIRAFQVDKEGRLIGDPIFGGPVNAMKQPQRLNFPSRWNVELNDEHKRVVKTAVAKALLPVLKQELQHRSHPNVIQRALEIDVRATCDICLTSIFSGSMVCRKCGREVCTECHTLVGKYVGRATDENRRTPKFRRFLACVRSDEHVQEDFIPSTRFTADEIENAVKEMEAIVSETGHIPLPREDLLFTAPSPIDASQWDTSSALSSPGSGVPGLSTSTESTAATSAQPSPFIPVTSLPAIDLAYPTEPTELGYPPEKRTASAKPELLQVPSPEIPSQDIQYYDADELTEEIFKPFWLSGRPLVVRGLLPKFQLEWTPEYFMRRYGKESCTIVDCESESTRSSTVYDFFKMFGKYEERHITWKLKDWPPQADFKSTFPELFDDFHRAVPIPNYTRRDGVLNISSHFPVDAIAPDIGPKMYNALESNDGPGGKGSTRLHMDMADAVNVMLYASARRDGTPGTAAWDIFRAEDSDKIRQFLTKQFPSEVLSDPIHSQSFYLDSELRRQLYEEYGVYSWRIYQKPGEAVFIPAGCAHQVCNLADCIKVAVDFVSPENIDRCEVLTREFREQNHLVAWKEDVLQLRTMMWYAWTSCGPLPTKESAKLTADSMDID